jgi:glutamyl-tRNA synthetase
MIRTRIAPSPTGPLHIGTARAALFNYLFAKKQQGQFILRIEDTDKTRSKTEYELDIIRHLNWLKITPDKTPIRQSERMEIYQKYLKDLLEQGRAFWCYHSKEELQKEQAQARKNKRPPVHWCDHKQDKIQDTRYKIQKRGIIRFATPRNTEIAFEDKIRGKIAVNTETLGNFSIAKSLTEPLYNFAAAIDDHLMAVSHVIRGEDHISNTPKQILILESLGWEKPIYAHLPLILGPDLTKLSKRHGAVPVAVYRKLGYLPEALVNFMALLGWHPPDNREFFTLKELVQEFSLKRVKKGGAVFDIQKLDNINSYYLRQLSGQEFTKAALPFLAEQVKPAKNQAFKVKGYQQLLDWETVVKIVTLEQERIKKLSDIADTLKFIFLSQLKYEPNLLKWKKMSFGQIRKNLNQAKAILGKIPEKNFSAENLKTALISEAEKQKDLGLMLWPLRAALTGQATSPGPFEVAAALGKQRSLQRIEKALDKCRTYCQR